MRSGPCKSWSLRDIPRHLAAQSKTTFLAFLASEGGRWDDEEGTIKLRERLVLPLTLALRDPWR